jgi:hypothetical protein
MKLTSRFLIFNFIHFLLLYSYYVGYGSKAGSGTGAGFRTGMHSVSDFAKAKSSDCGSGSGSTTLVIRLSLYYRYVH